MAMTYSDWLTSVTTILQLEDTYGQAFFTAMAPRIIERAELYMYRDPDLDFLATRTTDESQVTINGLRSVAIAPQIIVLEGVNLIIPAQTTAAQGTRVPLTRADRNFCDRTWPTEAQTKAPNLLDDIYYAVYSQFEATGSGAEADEPVSLPSAFIIAPTPDAEYRVEQTGTFRPAPLSATNQTTFLTQYLPDLFVAASVVAGALYQRDFGATGAQQDPSLATHWEDEYRRLKLGAAVESARQKSKSTDWSVYAPAQLAQPQQPARQ